VDPDRLLQALNDRGLEAVMVERAQGGGGRTVITVDGGWVELVEGESKVEGTDFETLILVQEAIREQLQTF